MGDITDGLSCLDYPASLNTLDPLPCVCFCHEAQEKHTSAIVKHYIFISGNMAVTIRGCTSHFMSTVICLNFYFNSILFMQILQSCECVAHAAFDFKWWLNSTQWITMVKVLVFICDMLVGRQSLT